jgi:glycosyltransferase involved in cell wall biosynthesis
MKISACVITKNEENNIGTCLESLKTIATEMIVVDTGSNDRTVEIAKEYGAKIYQYEWQNDFSAAKNYALGKAKGDWIIFLDADEYFPDTSIEQVKTYMKNMDKNRKCDAICVRIVNIDQDKENQEISSFTNVRIFRNKPNLKYKNAVHEELLNSQGLVNMFMMMENIEVYHTGYSSNIVEQKLQRNLEILLHDIAENGDQVKYYRYLCDCYHGLGEYDKAVKYGRMHIQENLGSLGTESVVYTKVIDSLIRMKATASEIKTEIEKAIKKFPNIPDFYGDYGIYCWKQQEYEVALEYLLQAVEIYKSPKQECYEADSFNGKISIIYFMIGDIYSLKNQDETASSYYAESLLKHKYNAAVFQRIYWLIADNNPVEVIAILNSIYSRTPKDIKFIVENLSPCQKNKVFIYYSNILAKDFSDEVKCMWQYQMFGLKNYQKLYTKSAERMRAKLCLVAAMIIAQADPSAFETRLELLPKCYKNIINRFFRLEQSLSDKDFKGYLEILYELLPLDRNSIDPYLELAVDFSPESVLKIAENLKQHNQYARAIVLYEKIKISSAKRQVDCYAELGYCYYKLGRYFEAITCFLKVLQENPENQKIMQLKKWSESFLLKEKTS